MIPFNDFAIQVAETRSEIDAAIRRVLDRGWFILGPEGEKFEQLFAWYFGGGEVIGVANGTDALQLALMALNIGPGDEVICPALTAAPTALAILAAGARPVFADIDPQTYTLDQAHLEACLSEKTRAVMPVHLYGLAAKLDAIHTFTEKNGLALIEDCAQAHGAKSGGKFAGTVGLMGCFSFYPTKNVGAYGDGGAILTHDASLAETLRQLRNLGQSRRFQHDLPGLNSRLDEIQAAILQVKLAHLDAHNAARRERAHWYHEGLADLPEICLPHEPEGDHHVYHLYVIRSPHRDALQVHLRSLGIGSDIHYPIPLHQQAAFSGARVSPLGLSVTEQTVREILSLPMYPQLNRGQVRRVTDALREKIELLRD